MIPGERIILDVTGDAFVICLAMDNMFVIITLPDVAGIQFASGAGGDGGHA